MMFKQKFQSSTFALILSIVLGTTLSGCDSSDAEDTTDNELVSVDDNGNTSINLDELDDQLNTLSSDEITAQERAGLLFMREEEKLAHDVYVALYAEFQKDIFINISKAELTHTESMLALLEKYDIADPVGSNEAGLFVDQSLQNLYDTLVATGKQSLIDALLVGAAIEEIDIIDIQVRKEELIDNEDIALVYDSLTKGSRNHLRSFVKNLSSQGAEYEPQYLSQAEYDEIISGDIENGQ